MPQYTYIGLDRTGSEHKGRIEAGTEKDAVAMLRDQAVYVLKIREGDSPERGDGLFSLIGRVVRALNPVQYLPVGARDLTVFFRQLALMLRAGYTLVSALELSGQMQAKHRLNLTIQRMAGQIRRGESFSSALGGERVFSSMAGNLIASGEQSGNLDIILERLADSMERSRELKLQFITAMFYPSFVLLASIGVIVMMLVFVIPKFSDFLAARHASLPDSMLMLLAVSDWFIDWGAWLGGVLGLSVFFILAACTTPKGKGVVDGVILQIPIIGQAVQLSAMAQAGWSLSMLLKSGVTALESLRITSGVIGNLAISDCFNRAAQGLLEGRSLSKTFDQPHFPLIMRHMAAVGESSGQLDTVMEEMGEYYQKELLARVKLMATMVEPVMILGVGMVVLFVYKALFQSVMAVSKGGM